VSPIDEVADALALAHEAIEARIDDARRLLSDASASAPVTELSQAVQRITDLTGFADSIADAMRTWTTFREDDVDGDEQVASRLPHGVRTPEETFCVPILRALVKLGGKAPLRDVLDLVGEDLASHLNETDRTTLPSDPRQVRWRNTAQWARNTLVRRGLVEPVRERGVWEISQAGRDHLAKLGE
jgi:restriction system protein